MIRHATVAALVAVLAACSAEHHPKVEVAPLERQAVRVALTREVLRPVGDEVVATVRARSASALSSSVMGTVRTLKVTLGSHVRAGDVLVQLNAGEIEARASRADAMFAQASLDLKRAEQLKATKSIADSQYDQTAAQYRVAKAAKADADVMRAYTVIRAPFAGVITAKECSVGDLALPGKPLLVLESSGSLRLEASVPEAIAHFLRLNETMSVHIDALGRQLEATVGELSPSSDAASRTVLVKLDLPPNPELRPGMFGRLVVRTGEEPVVLVRTDAVVRRGQMETVYVVENKAARLRLIRTGRTYDGETEVLAGLSANEPVVVAHPRQLIDGQPLVVKDEGEPLDRKEANP